MIEVALLVLILVILLVERLPTLQRKVHQANTLSKALTDCAKTNEDLNHAMLLMENDRKILEGKIAGLEIEREVLEKEVNHLRWKVQRNKESVT